MASIFVPHVYASGKGRINVQSLQFMLACFLIVGPLAPIASAAPCDPGPLASDPSECAGWVGSQARQAVNEQREAIETLAGNLQRRIERQAENAQEEANDVAADVLAVAQDRVAPAGDALSLAVDLVNDASATVERRLADAGAFRCPVSRGVTPPPSIDALVRAGIALLPHASAASHAEATYDDVRNLDAWCAEQFARL